MRQKFFWCLIGSAAAIGAVYIMSKHSGPPPGFRGKNPLIHVMSDKTYEKLPDQFHQKLCTTDHKPGTEGFPCGDAMEVVRARWDVREGTEVTVEALPHPRVAK